MKCIKKLKLTGIAPVFLAFLWGSPAVSADTAEAGGSFEVIYATDFESDPVGSGTAGTDNNVGGFRNNFDAAIVRDSSETAPFGADNQYLQFAGEGVSDLWNDNYSARAILTGAPSSAYTESVLSLSFSFYEIESPSWGSHIGVGTGENPWQPDLDGNGNLFSLIYRDGDITLGTNTSSVSGTLPTYNQGQAYTIVYIMNWTGETETVPAPDGSSVTLEDGQVAFWLIDQDTGTPSDLVILQGSSLVPNDSISLVFRNFSSSLANQNVLYLDDISVAGFVADIGDENGNGEDPAEDPFNVVFSTDFEDDAVAAATTGTDNNVIGFRNNFDAAVVRDSSEIAPFGTDNQYLQFGGEDVSEFNSSTGNYSARAIVTGAPSAAYTDSVASISFRFYETTPNSWGTFIGVGTGENPWQPDLNATHSLFSLQFRDGVVSLGDNTTLVSGDFPSYEKGQPYGVVYYMNWTGATETVPAPDGSEVTLEDRQVAFWMVDLGDSSASSAVILSSTANDPQDSVSLVFRNFNSSDVNQNTIYIDDVFIETFTSDTGDGDTGDGDTGDGDTGDGDTGDGDTGDGDTGDGDTGDGDTGGSDTGDGDTGDGDTGDGDVTVPGVVFQSNFEAESVGDSSATDPTGILPFRPAFGGAVIRDDATATPFGPNNQFVELSKPDTSGMRVVVHTTSVPTSAYLEPVMVAFDLYEPAVGFGRMVMALGTGAPWVPEYNFANQILGIEINNGFLAAGERTTNVYGSLPSLDRESPYRIFMITNLSDDPYDYTDPTGFEDTLEHGEMEVWVYDYTAEDYIFGGRWETTRDGNYGGDNDLIGFGFRQYSGDDKTVYIDDLLIASEFDWSVRSEDGEEPVEPETWIGYDVGPGGWVDTGDWLGMVYVSNAPWVYSSGLHNWLYIDEDTVQSTGAWGFIPFPAMD